MVAATFSFEHQQPSDNLATVSESVAVGLEFSHAADALFESVAGQIEPQRELRLLARRAIEEGGFRRLKFSLRLFIDRCLGVGSLDDDGAWLERLASLRTQLPNLTPNGVLCPKREQILEFNHLQRTLAEALFPLGSWGSVESVHVPLNVRIVSGVEDAALHGRAYATNLWHSDVWAGEPIDGVVVHVPVFGDAQNIGVDFAELPRESEERYMKTFSSFNIADEFAANLRPYPDGAYTCGNVYFADSRLIHRTKRLRKGLRVSIDFRMRLRSTGLIRTLSDQAMAKERLCNYVPVEMWKSCGSSWLIVPDETMEQAKRWQSGARSAAKHPTQFQVQQLFK